MSEYKKLSFQPPKSYEEINKSRPTKRKNFNYTGQVQIDSQSIKIPLSNLNSLVNKDFSFDKGENTSQKRSSNTQINQLTSQQPFSPINYKYSQNVQSESHNEAIKIDQRLNNISNIKDKINGLLNSNRTQSRSVYNTPLTQKTRNIQTVNKERYTEAFSSKQQSEAPYSSIRQEKGFKSKYSYIPNQKPQKPAIDKVPVDPKKYQIELKKIDQQKDIRVPSPKRVRQPAVNCKFQGEDYVVKQYKKMYQYGPEQNNKSQIKIKQIFQNKLEQSIKKQSYLSKNLELDRKISAIKNKIIVVTPPSLQRQYQNVKNNAEEDIPQLTETIQISKLAKNLSKIVQMDIIILKLRQKFQKWSQQNKWSLLKSQLQSKGVSLQQKQIKQIFSISIHEKNPFGQKNSEYTLNAVKDLARLYAEAENEWTIEIDKNASLDSLAKQNFSMGMIDMNSKGTICLEDLVCFINLNSQKFYRSRDVAPLFKRLLKIEGKKIDKNIGEGILYGTFIEKLAK